MRDDDATPKGTGGDWTPQPGELVHLHDGSQGEVWRYLGDWPENGKPELGRTYKQGERAKVQSLDSGRTCWAPYGEVYQLTTEQEAAWRLTGQLPDRWRQ